MNAVDTNVLLYSVDRNEPAKQRIAQHLLLQLHGASEPTLLLWQVLGELAQQLRRWRQQNRLTPTEFEPACSCFSTPVPIGAAYCRSVRFRPELGRALQLVTLG